MSLFPEIRTEGGKIDFDRLKAILGETVDVGRERYGMNWPGKADCMKTIQAPSIGTLLPRPEKSENWAGSDNLIIEGDNLEVLKLLQKSYLGKVSVVYIDPPYNTGKDFIYPDNYSESLDTYLDYTGQQDETGRKFGPNMESDGRFHSKWLRMLYPRIFLARNLLSDDGVVFVSIDEKELSNLRILCDQIFGEENRVGIICWKNVTDNNPTLITPDNEFILCYAKSRSALPQAWTSRLSSAKDILQNEFDRLNTEGHGLLTIQTKIREFISDNQESVGFLSRYKFVDKDGIYTGSESVHNPRPGGYDFEIFHPTTGKPMRKPANGYRFPEPTFRKMEKDGIILFGEDEHRIVKIKKYLQDYEDSLRSVMVLDGRLGSYELKRLFPEFGTVFTNPKPTELIEALISFAGASDALVLDIFAGSGSTGHAVLNLNQKDKGTRRFILLQLPEPLADEELRTKLGIHTIADLTIERVRRAIVSLSKASSEEPKLELFSMQLSRPTGFRVFALSGSNFRAWDSELKGNVQSLTAQLALHIANIRDDRSTQDLLFEVLLKSGFPLTSKVEEIRFADKLAFSVSDGQLLICLERELSFDIINAIASLVPEHIICLDTGFAGNDQLKTNAVQTFRNKGVTSFKVV